MPSILITGDKGFIGSHLSDAFGQSVGYDLKDGKDIRNRMALDQLFETNHFDTVIHCAALTGVRRGEAYPEEYLSTNVIGTKNLVDLSEKYGVKHFIHFSSSSVYGEAGARRLSEDDPLEPNSIYGMSKLTAEKLVQRSNLDYTIIRPFTVYGDYGRPDQVLEKWINQANTGKPVSFYGEGNTGRGYTYIEDLILGLEAIIILRAVGIFNLGGSEYITLSELWELCGKPSKKYSPMPEGDRVGIYADTCKARDVLLWEPKTKIKEKIPEIWQKRVK